MPTPPDLKKALAKSKKAKEHWEKWAPSTKKRFVYWIEDAKRPETRERRIKRVVKQNQRIWEILCERKE